METVKDEALKSAATCTSAAVYYKSCECGAVSENDADTFTSGDPLAHSYTLETVKDEALKSAATCQGGAVYYKSCVCGEISENDADTFVSGTASAHIYDQEVIKDEALKTAGTCESGAVYYKSCVCGAISENDADTFTAEVYGHVYDQDIVKDEALKSEATCTGAAVYYKSCKCGAISESDEDTFNFGTALAHAYTVETVKDEALKSAATCESAAVYYKSCECGAISESDADTFTYGEKAAHSYVLETVKDEARKSVADCTNAAVYYKSCECGLISENDDETFTSGSELGHSYNKQSSTPATCESPATETFVCGSCGDSYVDDIGDALQHDINGVEAEEKHLDGCEYVLIYKCKKEGCGKDVEGKHVFKHTYVAKVTKDATCKEDGEKILTCSCGDTKTEPIEKDAVGHNWIKGENVVDGKRTDTCEYCGETKEVTVSNTNTSAATNANNLKDTELELKVDADINANIKLDDGVINTIGDKNITVSADKLSDTEKANLNIDENKLAQVGNNPIFNFTINDGTENISQFGAENYVTITLPYILEEGEDVDSIAVWFINESGELESIKATYNNGYVTFKTNHFSYYTVTRLTPEERCALYGCSFVEHVEEGSCTKDAYILKVCVRCHKTEKIVTAVADGHNYNAETHAATCTENGYTLYTCVDCGHSYRIRQNATGHSWSVEDSVEATCVVNGYTKYGCANCDAEYTDLYDKLPHVYESSVIAPTCETNGYVLHECRNCDHSYSDSYAPAYGHKYESTTWTWAEDHSSATLTFVCVNDSEHEMVLNANIGVITTNSVCSDYVKKVYTAAVSYNGKAYTDEKTVETGKLEHKFSADWKTDKNNHWRECVCGEKTDVGKHKYENETVNKAPTCSESGETTSYCVCGKTHVSVIPATREHDYKNGICTQCGAKNGDNYYLNLINSWKDIDGFVIKIRDLSYEVKQKDNTLLDELKLMGSIKQIDVAELALYVENGEINGAAIGSIEIFNGPIADAIAIYEFRALIEDGFVYITLNFGKNVTDNSYSIKLSVEEAIDKIFDDDVSLALNFIMDTAIPVIDFMLNTDPESIDDILASVFNIIFTFEAQEDDTYVATLDYDKLYALNDHLANKTVAEVVDIYFGDGSFDSIVEVISIILDYTPAELIEDLDDNGLNTEEIFAKINEFAHSTGAPSNFDIKDFIYGEEYANVTIGMLISGYEDDSYIDEFEENVVTPLLENSFYALISPNNTEKIKEAIDEIIGVISESVSVSFTTDKLGMLTSVNVNVDEFSVAQGEGEVFMNFELEILINERIDVTWSDIVDDIEGGIVLPSEDMLDDTLSAYYEGPHSGYVYYKGEEYRYSFGINIYASQPFYDSLNGVIFQPDCNGWMAYSVAYAARDYSFTIANINVDGDVVVLLIDEYSHDVVELVTTESGFTAIFEDGTEKEIIFDLDQDIDDFAKAYADIYFAVFEDPEGRYDGFGESINYFYNADLDEYSYESHHDLKYEYVVQGESCDEDGCTVYVSCNNCNYYSEEKRYWCEYEYDVMIDLSEYSACGGSVYVDRCTICGHIGSINDTNINCNFGESVEEEILDDQGNVIGYRYISSCTDCDLVFAEQEWREYETACEYRGYEGMYIYANGECIVACVDEWWSDDHEYENTYEMNGESCEDGYYVTRYCSKCGETQKYQSSGHYYNYRYIYLEELGLCGGNIEERYCTICNNVEYAYFNENCRWEYFGENADGYSIYECARCGATKLQYSENSEKDENCQYVYTEVRVYIVNGEEVYRYERSRTYTEHAYEYSYEFEGESCEDGYYVTEYCPDCGITERYHQKGHSEEWREIDLGELGLCGGSAEERYCPACGLVYHFYVNDWNCNWEYYGENADGYSMYECADCGATKLIASYDSEKDENCEYLHTDIRIYIIDGEEVYRREYSYIDSDHNYEYSYEFEGNGCEDGYKVICNCLDCGEYDEYYDSGHQEERERVELDQFGLCGGYITRRYCAICDTVLSLNVEDRWCDWNYAGKNGDGYSVYVCRECGATKLEFSVNGEKDENCQYESTNIYVYLINNEEVYRVEYSYISESHNYEYSYALDGETCDDGYTVTRYCPDCGSTRESYEWGHKEEFMGIELDCYGLCGGYVEYNYCVVCDEILYSHIYDGECDWQYVGENQDGYEEYECHICGATKICGKAIGEKDENCRFEYTETYIYFINGEEVFRFEFSEIRERHYFEHNAIMNGSSCTDGVTMVTTCKDCDFYNEEDFDHHNSYPIFDLNNVAGCCDEHYIYISGCPCGQDYHIGFDTLGFIYDEEQNMYVCENCDLTYEHNTRWVEEGCSKVEITYISVKLAGEELYSSETEVLYSDHSYKSINVSVNDGVTAITSVCEKCGNEISTEIFSADVVDHDGKCYYDFTFTPEYDGKYTIKGLADSDTYVTLYEIIDGEMVRIDTDDDSGNNGQFYLPAHLNAGTIYVYRIGFYGYDEEGIISFAFSEAISEDVVCGHDDRTYFTTLLDGSESCEDGTLNGRICSLCGYVDRISVDYYHHIVDREIIYLEEYGACYGEYIYRSCACGEQNDIYLNHCNDNWTHNQYEEDGKLVTVETCTCSSCGLRYDRSYYSVRDLENCKLTYYYEIVISVDGNLVVSTEYSEEHEEHEIEISAELMNGAESSCDDGIFVTEKCKYCDYEHSYESYHHQTFDKQIIDLSQYGNVCGGYVILRGCVCGEDAYLDTNNVLCDYDERWCDIWIDDVITDSQNTINGWYSYDYYSYIRTCAVTDPACGYKIRRATYWLKEENECRAYQYQTWQFGYDEETGTCLYEITFKTGNSRIYHNYTETNFDSETEKGERYDCQDCGSYLIEKNYYTSEGKHIKYERIVSNATEDGNDRYQEYVVEYSFDENGNSYTSYEYERVIRADGEEYWYEVRRTRESYTGTFGENGYLEYYSYSNSNGDNTSEEKAYVYYSGYRYCIFTMYTNGDFWERYDYTYSFEGECIRTESYSNSYGESWYETNNYCRDYRYETVKEPTCSQDGEERYCCRVCGTYKESYILEAHDHNWVNVTDNWYYCFTCGLENANGASGDIIMEDLTELYGNGENYVVGYYNRNNVEFTQYVCIVPADGTEIVVEGIELMAVEGIRAYAFSKADVEAFAEAKGYTDYEVRFVFVPYGADGSFDYAVTFTETTNIEVITGNVSFKDFIGEGETVDYVITPTEDGIWTFTSYSGSDSYAYLYDAEGEFLDENDDGSDYGNNFKITYELKAGETYTLSVRWYSNYEAGYMPLVFTCEPVEAE